MQQGGDGWTGGFGFGHVKIGEWHEKECDRRRGIDGQRWRGCGIGGRQGGRAGKYISNNVLFAREMHKISGKLGSCDSAVAGGRLELRPPLESSDLDEKVLQICDRTDFICDSDSIYKLRCTYMYIQGT